MRIVLQRVNSGDILVNGEVKTGIKKGISVLLGFTNGDSQKDVDFLANKILNLRLFDDEEKNRRWDLSVMQKNYEVLLISQFTLYGKLKGNKLDFHNAMNPEDAEKLYDQFVAKVRQLYKPELVKDGLFGLYREINLSLDGPVTINLESKKESDA